MVDDSRFGATQSFPADADDALVGDATARQLDKAPARIGRYRIDRALGKGGFGVVYLAHDDQLQRLVAVKVPHAHLVAEISEAETYLIEARTVANLDHANIVPVYDVGSSRQSPCFVVSKYIDGTNLTRRLSQSRLSMHAVVQLVMTVAEALHYAHKHGVVHRDVKPSNILLDKAGQPFVGDFGLALREQDVGRGPRYVGTPAYMSPEQARGEGHRVDGRSDVFSLGVVLYEALTGRHPFRGESKSEVLDQIASLEPRPLRQIDDDIPRELERICFTALSKRASERFSTAKDMAGDLRYLLSQLDAPPSHVSSPAPGPTSAVSSTPGATRPRTNLPDSVTKPVRIVPKGLRSFDEHDADFFLDLLSGPRDRSGLPDSIRFWKNRVEEPDSDKTFPVGLIYGPSGCGKSSLVRAGLLPHLATHVLPVYVEATARDTEARLLKGLRHRCPELAATTVLTDVMAALRLGQGIPEGHKILIVLDQFEQWLHGRNDLADSELVQCLRQCDGGRVQCLITVRDDFWLAVSRFMHELEIRLVEGQNSALHDLFDVEHANKVLMAFGQSVGKLPQKLNDLTKEHREFLRQAISGLAQEGKIIPVRLSLFSEMMKGKPWTPASLKAVGGTQGVGITFLEETFDSSTAPPEHRCHQRAARAVLNALLPQVGSSIKGQMRSEKELQEISGYAHRPRDFDDLVNILDSELRLITPTEKVREEEPVQPEAGLAGKHYQLTHDYMVSSLRDWHTRKQKETARGRAALALTDRAALWTSRPDRQQLPSLPQWLQIRCLTRKGTWTASQRKMMTRAGRVHGIRALVLASLAVLLGWIAYEYQGAMEARALTDRLLAATTSEVPEIVREMEAARPWLDAPLHEAQAEAEASNDRRQQLHVSLALLPVDPGQVHHVFDHLLDADPAEIPIICDALAPHRHLLRDDLWEIVESLDKAQTQQRLHAAAGLARYDALSGSTESARWERAAPVIVQDLLATVIENPSHFGPLVDQLRPVRSSLEPPLVQVYNDDQRPSSDRSFATGILAEYAADDVPLLVELLVDADSTQFAILFPRLGAHRTAVVSLLRERLDQMPDRESVSDRRERLTRQQANAALALWKLEGARAVRSMLKHSPDPTLRSYLIRQLGPYQVLDGRELMQLVAAEPDVTIRRALILALSDFDDDALPERSVLIEWLSQIFEQERDAGLHAAAKYLLCVLGEDGRVATALMDLRQTEQQVLPLHQSGSNEPPSWSVNGQGQTMIAFPGPLEFVIGSSPGEDGREATESQHIVRIGRSFAIAAETVSVAEYRRLCADDHDSATASLSSEDPVTYVSWFDAAVYCNRLSAQERIPQDQWCYEISADRSAATVRPNALDLVGYRLPTEAELEYAARAGAATSRFFGESDELLVRYGWYVPNSQGRLHPSGRLRPNDFGLFDTLGNVWNWCHDEHRDYSKVATGQVFNDESLDSLIESAPRTLRGACYTDHSPALRVAHRWARDPDYAGNLIGFRIARTVSPL